MTKKKAGPVALLAGLSMLCMSAVAGPTADPAAFGEAQSHYKQALNGDSDALDQALEKFHALSAADPKNPLFAVYYGSTQTLRARDALMPWNKMKFSEEGLDTIDKALRKLQPMHDAQLVRGVPVSIETRLVAARTFLALPKFLNRREHGLRLVADAIASPAFAATPPPLQEQLRRLAATSTGESGSDSGH